MRFLLLLLAATIFSCGGGSTLATQSGPAQTQPVANDTIVYVVNEAPALLSDVDLQSYVYWQQLQLDNEFHAAWGVRATLVIAEPPDSDAFVCRFIPDHPNGYQGFRQPPHHAYVNMRASLERGTPCVTMSHEILEGLIDPTGGGIQVCDPVAPYGYQQGTKELNPAQVADFVYPSYWTGGPGPWDWLGLVPAPGQPAKGGR